MAAGHVAHCQRGRGKHCKSMMPELPNLRFAGGVSERSIVLFLSLRPGRYLFAFPTVLFLFLLAASSMGGQSKVRLAPLRSGASLLDRSAEIQLIIDPVKLRSN